MLLQSKVFDSEGRFYALGCRNHQHKHVRTKPWPLEAGRVTSEGVGSMWVVVVQQEARVRVLEGSCVH